jgi:hypothetical protein
LPIPPPDDEPDAEEEDEDEELVVVPVLSQAATKQSVENKPTRRIGFRIPSW